MKKKGYILLSVICAVVLIATGIILGVVMKKQSNKKTYTASIKTAEKYLEAGDYTQAVVAYKTAIEKMPEKETGCRTCKYLSGTGGYFFCKNYLEKRLSGHKLFQNSIYVEWNRRWKSACEQSERNT